MAYAEKFSVVFRSFISSKTSLHCAFHILYECDSFLRLRNSYVFLFQSKSRNSDFFLHLEINLLITMIGILVYFGQIIRTSF